MLKRMSLFDISIKVQTTLKKECAIKKKLKRIVLKRKSSTRSKRQHYKIPLSTDFNSF
jgi:hypothetical protein